MIEPFPCPLCGDTELDGGPFPLRRGDNPEQAVRCGNPLCGCEVIGPSRDEAVRRWNRRPMQQEAVDFRSVLTQVRAEIVAYSGLRTEYQDWSDALDLIDGALKS